MISFIKPKNLNGSELMSELKNVNIDLNDLPMVDESGTLWLNIDEKMKTTAEAIVAKHDGTVLPIDKSALKAAALEKLVALGLTADDLKALGL
jgi:hypothetical protein